MKFRMIVLLLTFVAFVTGCTNIEKEESKITQQNIQPIREESAALNVVDNEIENAPISGATFEKSFNIQPNFEWVKIRVHNTSSETLRVRVTQGTITGTEKMFFELAPGAQKSLNGTQPWATGIHWIAFSTKNGGTMSGRLSVELAEAKEAI